MEFGEIFGFEPATGGIEKVVQQMVIDVRLSNLACACSGTAATLDDLRRALKRIENPDSQAVSVLATMMAKVEGDAVSAQAAFDEAVQIAKAAGFVALGKIDDVEAKRIFGLSEVHQPLSAGEQTRIAKVLQVLAVRFHLARARELDDRQRGARDVQHYNSLLEAIVPAKQAFWEAHELASRLGARVEKTYEECIPWDLAPYYGNLNTCSLGSAIHWLGRFLKENSLP